MIDLISRNDAIEAIDFEKVYMTAYLGYVNEGNPLKQYNKGLDDAIKAINKLPSVEPEREIIHCKDCKFYTPMNRTLKTGICDMTMHHLGDDGFCSTAEKRGE